MLKIDAYDENFDLQFKAELARLAGAWSGVPNEVDILVPSNSAAGQYAAKIHDEQGKSWRNLGVGSLAKGRGVGGKFIERAIEQMEPQTVADLAAGFDDSARTGTNSLGKQLRRIGMRGQRIARDNAPRSPSKAQYKQGLKTQRGRKRSKARLFPGGLEKSIIFEVR